MSGQRRRAIVGYIRALLEGWNLHVCDHGNRWDCPYEPVAHALDADVSGAANQKVIRDVKWESKVEPRRISWNPQLSFPEMYAISHCLQTEVML